MCIRVYLTAVAVALWVLPATADDVSLQLQYDREAPQKQHQAFYWSDAAGNAYSKEYRDSFTYESAEVTVTYESPTKNPLRGRITGSGLKPNFVYQLKIEGKPTAKYGDTGDDEGNEKIGFAGRWWRENPDPANATDGDYRRDKGKPGYVYVGYLLASYVVTDHKGDLDAEFAFDSSYHVLWQVGQSRKRSDKDGEIRRYVLTVPEDNPRYEVVVPESVVEVYGEVEPGRALPGKLQLAPGKYIVRLIVTEESWHKITPGWASVVLADLTEFRVLP